MRPFSWGYRAGVSLGPRVRLCMPVSVAASASLPVFGKEGRKSFLDLGRDWGECKYEREGAKPTSTATLLYP